VEILLFTSFLEFKSAVLKVIAAVVRIKHFDGPLSTFICLVDYILMLSRRNVFHHEGLTSYGLETILIKK